MGAYAVRYSFFDVYVMLFFAAAGYVFRCLEIPVVPVAFGVVLGLILEDNVRRTLNIHQDWFVFLERAISLTMSLVSLAAIVFPIIAQVWRRRGTGGGSGVP